MKSLLLLDDDDVLRESLKNNLTKFLILSMRLLIFNKHWRRLKAIRLIFIYLTLIYQMAMDYN